MPSKRRIVFVDRDGTLIEEPADYQVDAIEKVRLVKNVIPALLSLRDQGYELIVVSNQDGLGTDSFPEADFHPPQQMMEAMFSSQGITFTDQHFDPHFEEDQAFTRKPNIGMVLPYLQSGELDMENSYVIGDRITDLQLAENMGIQGYRVGPDGEDWLDIAQSIIDKPRQAQAQRKTNETDIQVFVDLDNPGSSEIQTGLGFFDHMLEQLAAHGGFQLKLNCSGDLHIDEHHTVEDCALTLGQALKQALGNKRGIGRYGFVLPMDEALAEADIDLEKQAVAVDLSDRPILVFDADFPRDQVGDLSTEMVEHFFYSLAQSLGAALHIQVKGKNTHHMVEGIFKALGRALRSAFLRQDQQLPSTKGVL